ncbi:DUF3151 domain-containing protein [Goodfellowiella coeruleoviolacea]|uniref:DUF3151 domain-containing protein n=1 Tax=Goodfellowiella coeruleoviolacea TaxID=334858 RepID=A0AAE3GEB6_9PSEU|nr:DUF3151 domain-containing protein [Goodfellowiella coeruleoviolacea]MCP2166188.1 Protein of unknown function (DUF3151) [Goodfellowiella coeruleoviolacea]
MALDSNLLGPEPTRLPERPDAQAALAGGTDPAEVVRAHPDFSEAWAALAERALRDGDPVTGYAFARTGYHRGLDQLRRAGWKGHGPIPWAHRPNQGFLRALAALARAAEQIGEVDEQRRCAQFLADSDPEAVTATGLGSA